MRHTYQSVDRINKCRPIREFYLPDCQCAPDRLESLLVQARPGRIYDGDNVLVVDVPEDVVEDVLCLPGEVGAVGDAVHLRVSLRVPDVIIIIITINLH